MYSLLPKDNLKNFNTADEYDCVAVVKRLPALHYSVDSIFLFFVITDSIVELGNHLRDIDEA